MLKDFLKRILYLFLLYIFLGKYGVYIFLFWVTIESAFDIKEKRDGRSPKGWHSYGFNNQLIFHYKSIIGLALLYEIANFFDLIANYLGFFGLPVFVYVFFYIIIILWFLWFYRKACARETIDKVKLRDVTHDFLWIIGISLLCDLA